ncbi:MAG: hypothetical protein HY428_02260 [Candidatus Levybacteria bacterium]|nr:hypothetical protein [Candidatus Levybacteria bacterium]
MKPFDSTQGKQLILIDGNAILHRAFHALPGLTAPNGDLVNAVYGFFSMFLRVLEDIKPEYAIVCFDRPKPTFRKTLYVGYQAHRPVMAEGLGPQITVVHDLLNKMNVPIFEVDGYEADDVIGTLAKQAIEDSRILGDKDTKRKDEKSPNLLISQSPNIEVIIVTGDRDLLQLVNSHVKVLSPVVGLKETILYDEKKVEEKFGITPSQIVDYKALIGDPSDGYPGVSGIGPKTARQLLQEYKTFENLYQNVDKLPVRISEKLATDAEQAALAKKLATIVIDVPVKLVLPDCVLEKFNMVRLKDAFEALGFQSLIKRITLQVKRQEEAQKEKIGKQLGLL